MTGILVATRNRDRQLRLTLESFQVHGYAGSGLKILVVDDGSEDRTAAVCAEHAMERLEVGRSGIRGYRRNPSAVLNAGHAALSDCDVVVEQGGEVVHLTPCAEQLAQYCRPGVVALARTYNGDERDLRRVRSWLHSATPPANLHTGGANLRTDAGRWPAAKVEPEVELYCGLERPVPFLFCGAIHRADYEAVGGYNESLDGRNDQDLAERLLARGVGFLHVGAAVAFHLRHGKT